MLLLIVAFAVACGSPSSEDTDPIIYEENGDEILNNQNSSAENTPENKRARAIFDSYNAPSGAKAAADEGLSITIEAVVMASIAGTNGQQLVTTGTLTQTGQQFTYSSEPSDRLVIKWTEGPATEIYVSQFNGDFNATSINDFFGSSHIVYARIVREGLADIEVYSSRGSNDREGGIRGTLLLNDVSYTLDL